VAHVKVETPGVEPVDKVIVPLVPFVTSEFGDPAESEYK
jgi:hypothetical protein